MTRPVPAPDEIEDRPPIAPTQHAPSRVIALDGKILRDEPREIAVEVPVLMSFADMPFAVMMVTPTDLRDYAYGFSLTEGVIERADEIRDIAIGPSEDGLILRIDLAGERLHRHLARQRAMTGRTGCGICGIDDIKALSQARGAKGGAPPIAIDAIAKALTSLDSCQTLNASTRAAHGAAWSDMAGQLHEVREDVGRHNALDKLIGALVQRDADANSGFIVITSRCSFEMVEKAAMFGAHTVVAISAPTSLAIARAEALGLTLIAVARRDTLTVFTNLDAIVTR